jgi:hypothetical protein
MSLFFFLPFETFFIPIFTDMNTFWGMGELVGDE